MKITITTILLLSFAFSGITQDAIDIMRTAEEKMRGKESSYTEMTIKTVRPKWTMEVIFGITELRFLRG
ncbi:hypothetical protein N8Z47_02400 [Salibacteraceae bacterium]|jgi:hypothetical protein|nr:hypothetical protein [Salibacteraceae bacterium]